MYDAKYIVPGIILFFVVFSSPFWLNAGSKKYDVDIKLPSNATACVEDKEYMRAEHMQLLDTWRDMALREEKREYTSTKGVKWEISLQNTCMKCHVNYAEFCDKCHTANSVSPYCWDCHVLPKGNQK